MAFQDAYQQLVASENSYSGLRAATQEAVDNLQSRFGVVDELLQQFRDSLEALSSDFVLKQEAEMILSNVNATFMNARDLSQNATQVQCLYTLKRLGAWRK